MNKKETKEAIEVMQAFADGKVIQFLDRHNEWQDLDPNKGMGVSWDWFKKTYRIKSEPHYRPFKDAEEVMEAIKEHGDWLDSSVGYKVNISEFNNSMIWIGAAKGGITFDDAFNNYHFEKDGTPFGKLEE